MSLRARDAAYTVLDFETTGAVPGYPEEPWQIAFCEISSGRLTANFREDFLRITTARPFSPYAPGNHARLRDTLAAAPTPADCFPAWKPWLEGKILVAHNVPTERRLLRHIAPMHDFSSWVDTLGISRRLLPGLNDYSLANVCAALNLEAPLRARCPGRDWHDALFDATAAALLLETALAQPGWQNISLSALMACR